jgi:tRNA C32,U32 (ribose-2'-O)-methylase TrmJ
MARTLCEWKKSEIVDDIEELAEIVRDPRFVCRKCARSAHKDKHLCKPMALPRDPSREHDEHQHVETTD